MDGVIDVCRFNLSSSRFVTKYIVNETTLTLTPCVELSLTVIQHLPLTFVTISTLFMFHFRLSPRIGTAAVQWIFAFKSVAAAATAIIFTVVAIVGHSTSQAISIIYVFESIFLVFIWTLYFILWAVSLFCSSWTNKTGIHAGFLLAYFNLIIVASQRWLLFGLSNIYTILALIVVALHLIGIFINILEWRLRVSYAYARLINSENATVDGYIVLKNNGDEGVGYFSRIFFCWTNDLIRKGYKLQLNEITDLFQLPKSLDNERLEKRFFENAPTLFVDAEEFSLTKTLFKVFGFSFFSLGILKFFSDMLVFAGPLLLNLLIVCLMDDKCIEEGYLYCVIMILASFISAMLSSNFNFYITKLGLKIKSVISTTLYDKLLRVRLSTLSKFSSGQILNFMSSDTDRIVGFCNSFHAFWSMPLQFGVALYFLYQEVGLAFISGLIAAMILVPLNKWLTFKIGQMSAKMMKYKDERAKLVSETVRSIRTVKLSDWEDIMLKRINRLRGKELIYLRNRKYLDAVCVYLWASAPILITISIFFSFTLLMNGKLTPAKVFTSLSLVNILIVPLNAFPWVLSSIVEAVVSVRRLNAFFALKNIDLASHYGLTTDSHQPLQVDYAYFSWSGESTVKNVSFRGAMGTVIGLVGPFGCGKTTLLLGILGEIEAGKRRIRIKQETIRKGFAYVSQDCWLRQGTIKENIICGAEFDVDFYNLVIAATALKQDILMMPGADEFQIGDGGCLLSGGQRARLSLARALYQEREIYLLDDPFASLDSKVGKYVWNEAVINLLRNRGKLVIVATHRIEYLKDADEVLVFDSLGNVLKQGPSSIVLHSEVKDHEIENVAQLYEDPKSYEQVKSVPEEKQQGKVRLSVYQCYALATGVILTVSIFVSLSAMQVSKNVSDWWLSKWAAALPINLSVSTNHNESSIFEDYIYESLDLLSHENRHLITADEWDITMFYLVIYGSMALGNTIFTFLRAFLFAFGGIRAARNLHSKLLRRVLNASVSWWESTPAGRVINRLCADVYLVDDSLPFQFNIFLASSFNLFGSIVITFLALPLLAPLIVLLFVIYYLVQRYFRFTTCDVKRLTSMSLSPYYSHLTDTIAGLSTIRAFRFAEDFTVLLRKKLTDIIRAQFSALATTQWLSIRLQIFGVFVLSAVVIAALLQRQLNFLNSSMVGLAITYALSVTNLLNTLLTSFVETEKELISVERIEDYATRARLENNESSIPVSSKSIKGRVEFSSVSLRYASGLPLALDNVSFQIEPGTRIAIIGRTGSGKSSLLHVLLRAYEIESGKIFIDGIDIHSVELHSLRSLFGVVTQTPFVFSGSLRENLTLDRPHCDFELTRLMEVEQLRDLVVKLGGLDASISEGGANLSFGEKQIIATCRVLISRPKIVLFDEATAHLDFKTHSTMNLLVRDLLPSATVISLIHRLHDIENYDVVIKMDAGRIIWKGPPSELFTDD